MASESWENSTTWVINSEGSPTWSGIGNFVVTKHKVHQKKPR